MFKGGDEDAKLERQQAKEARKADRAAARDVRAVASAREDVLKALANLEGNVMVDAEDAYRTGRQLFQTRFLLSTDGARSVIIGGLPWALRLAAKAAQRAYGWSEGVLDTVEAAGWELQHVTTENVPIGSVSRDKVLSTGQQEQIASQTWAMYVFRRNPHRRLAARERFRPLDEVEVPGVSAAVLEAAGWPDWFLANSVEQLKKAGLLVSD